MTEEEREEILAFLDPEEIELRSLITTLLVISNEPASVESDTVG